MTKRCVVGTSGCLTKRASHAERTNSVPRARQAGHAGRDGRRRERRRGDHRRPRRRRRACLCRCNSLLLSEQFANEPAAAAAAARARDLPRVPATASDAAGARVPAKGVLGRELRAHSGPVTQGGRSRSEPSGPPTMETLKRSLLPRAAGRSRRPNSAAVRRSAADHGLRPPRARAEMRLRRTAPGPAAAPKSGANGGAGSSNAGAGASPYSFGIGEQVPPRARPFSRCARRARPARARCTPSIRRPPWPSPYSPPSTPPASERRAAASTASGTVGEVLAGRSSPSGMTTSSTCSRSTSRVPSGRRWRRLRGSKSSRARRPTRRSRSTRASRRASRPGRTGRRVAEVLAMWTKLESHRLPPVLA